MKPRTYILHSDDFPERALPTQTTTAEMADAVRADTRASNSPGVVRPAPGCFRTGTEAESGLSPVAIVLILAKVTVVLAIAALWLLCYIAF